MSHCDVLTGPALGWHKPNAMHPVFSPTAFMLYCWLMMTCCAAAVAVLLTTDFLYSPRSMIQLQDTLDEMKSDPAVRVYPVLLNIRFKDVGKAADKYRRDGDDASALALEELKGYAGLGRTLKVRCPLCRIIF